jgi:hypothetical protein
MRDVAWKKVSELRIRQILGIRRNESFLLFEGLRKLWYFSYRLDFTEIIVISKKFSLETY